MNDQSTTLEQIERIRAHCYCQNRRALLLISGSRDWCEKAALSILLSNKQQAEAVHWVADDLPSEYECYLSNRLIHIHRARAQRLLGNELDNIVLNAFDGLNANLLASVAGTLKGGGLFVLLTPTLDDWPDYDDPDYQRFQTWQQPPAVKSGMTGLFIERFAKYLQQKNVKNSDCFLHLTEKECCIGHHAKPIVQPDLAGNASAAVVQSGDTECLNPTPDQQQVVQHILELIEQSSGSLLLSADRGRGKTTALAFAINELLDKVAGDIVITAPLRNHVNTLFSTLPRCARAQHSDISQRVYYRAADQLLMEASTAENNPSAALLIVDEAAALSLPLLQKLHQCYRHIVFTSTVQGYEGSGRGFLLRFQDFLSSAAGFHRHIVLHKPIRWAEDDWLESFINRLLCLGSSVINQQSTMSATFKVQAVTIRKLSKSELLASEGLLQAVFGLLVEAHYQTQPNDLRYMLDTVDTHLWVAQSQAQVLGVLLVVEEGGFASQQQALMGDIVSGRRRPKGNLLVQRMANHSGNALWCEYRALRVMRIAVVSSARRNNIASQLLQSMQVWAQDNDFDIWTSSFGYEKQLCQFWQALATMPIYLGMHLDKASAARNLMVAAPLSARAVPLCNMATTALREDLAFYTEHYLPEFTPVDKDQLLQWCTTMVGNIDDAARLQKRDQLQLQRFALGEIHFASIYPALCRWLEQLTADGIGHMDSPDMQLLVDCVAVAPDWQQLATQFGVNGQGQVMLEVKQVLRRLLPVAVYSAD